MEGEVFADNVLGSKMPHQGHETLNAKLVNGISGVNGVVSSAATMVEVPRKPWEKVHFASALKPKQYQIEGKRT